MTWNEVDPTNEAMVDQRNDAVRRLVEPLTPVRRALDLGCGRGSTLRDVGLTGVGVDLSILRLRLAPVPVAQADGAGLPFPDDAFDVVMLVNVLSSVPVDAHRRSVLEEVRRVLEPGGSVVWYDQRWPNPANRATRALRHRDLQALLPGARIDLEPITLVPALARTFPRSYDRLHRLRSLRSHLVGLIRFD
jgi:SAM-dependent methyltransferase